VDVFVIDAVPSHGIYQRALRAAGLPSDLVCDAVTGSFDDGILVIMPSYAGDRLKLTEALRVVSLFFRESVPMRRIYALATKDCSWPRWLPICTALRACAANSSAATPGAGTLHPVPIKSPEGYRS
jgi:hypothetical protein